MSSPAQSEMDVDAFLVWAEGRQGRWELRDGRPVMMAPERAAHALTKYAAQKALENGVKRAGLPCRMFPDGMTVRSRRARRLRAGRPRRLPTPRRSQHDGDPEPDHRRRGSVAEHGRGRSRRQARRLFRAAKRGALPHSRRRPPRHDLAQARRRGRDRNPCRPRRRHPPRPARF